MQWLLLSVALVLRTDGVYAGTRTARSAGVATVPVVEDSGFWFANFTVGAAGPLSLLLDTGSYNVIINPGLYEPGPHANNTGKTFNITYDTTGTSGTGTASATCRLYMDQVALEGTSIESRDTPIGDVVRPRAPPPFPHAHAGIVGLAQTNFSGPTWLGDLCRQQQLAQCRFGVQFGTEGTGQLTMGGVNTASFRGPLTTVALPVPQYEWILQGDVAANGQIVARNATLITDTGTPTIFGPIAGVRAMFKAAGIQIVETPATSTAPASLNGYYPCSHPPQLGFAFPSTTGAQSPIFNVLPHALAEANNNGNCTAVIHGTDQFNGQWIIGQPFYQGHYVDHNRDAGTMGFAILAW